MKHLIPFVLFCSAIGVLPPSLFAEDTPVKIGALLPLSGELSAMGTRASLGIKLAATEAGSTVQVIIEDSGNSARSAVTAAQKLLEIDHVAIIVGPFGVDQTLAVAEITERKKIPLFSYSLCGEKFTQYHHVVCGYPSSRKQLAKLGKLLAAKKASRLAFLRDESEFGEELIDIVHDVISKQGIDLVYRTSLPASSTDFRSIVAKVRASQPNAILAATVDPSVTFAFLKQMKESDFNGIMIGFIDFDPKYLSEFGNVLDGLYLPGVPPIKLSQQFTKKFKSAFRDTPNVYSALGYDLMKLVVLTLDQNRSMEDLVDRATKVAYRAPAIPSFKLLSDRSVDVALRTLVVHRGRLSEVPGL